MPVLPVFFLESQKKDNPLAATLLTNTSFFSIDYSPSQYTRTRIQEPRYLNSLVKRGIEGYVVVEFDVNEDGSTSKHSILVSEPGNYFDAEALEASKNLRYKPIMSHNWENINIVLLSTYQSPQEKYLADIGDVMMILESQDLIKPLNVHPIEEILKMTL